MSPFRRRKKAQEPLEPRDEPQGVELDPKAPSSTNLFEALRSTNYEPHFPRTSVTRRVLGHITPEVDKDEFGPRNTLPALTAALIADDHTEIHYPEQVQPYLDALVEAGLVSVTDEVYTVTEAGWRELTN